ncbi:MAG: hypothetical protein NUV50_00130 [Rhodospirillales bacterium]|nr:hypothetical protein [Rhodospirillales bacterium]
MRQFKQDEAEAPMKPVGWPKIRPSVGPGSRFSRAHICRLWDYRSLLLYRAERAMGDEGRHLLSQADGVVCDIAQCLGKEPSVIKSLNDLGDLKKLFVDME